MNQKEYYVMISEHNHFRDCSEAEVHNMVTKAESMGIQIVHIESELYPNLLRIIAKPPLVLFCWGDVSLLNTPGVPRLSVVGTRRASPYGKWVAGELGKTIAKCGAVHISGMAEGIDSAGHRGALESGGKSIGVLGTGVDICFPRSSADVYENLKTKGLLVSEYPLGIQGFKNNFPERNRIISGLSEKCIVVEGALKSGSLITARIALEQNKEIFAVPGNINQPNSIGPNTLIEDGAIPIANPTEIAETLGIGVYRNAKESARLTGLERKIYEIVHVSGSIQQDELIAYLGVSAEKVLASLTMLEIKGLVRNESGLIS